MFRAVLGSLSLFTIHAMKPPSQPRRIGMSHQAPLMGFVVWGCGVVHPDCGAPQVGCCHASEPG